MNKFHDHNEEIGQQTTACTQVTKLTIINNTPQLQACQVWLYEPITIEEKRLGQLTALTQINNSSSYNLEIADAIFQDFQQAYYAQAGSSISIATAFENSLKQLNQQLNNYLAQQSDRAEWLKHLNTIVVVVKNQEIHFSFAGQVSAWLLRDGRLFPLAVTATTEAINPLKIFSQLLSGRLENNDLIVLSNLDFTNYLTKEKIVQTMNQPLAEIQHQLKNIFWPINNINLGAIIIKREKLQMAEAITLKTRKIFSPQKSMSNLLSVRERTQSLLTQSLWSDLKKFGQNLSYQFKSRVLKQKPQPNDHWRETAPITKAKESLPARIVFALLLSFKGIYLAVKRLGQKIISLVRGLFSQRQRLKDTPYEVEGSIVRTWHRLKQFNKTSKILLTVAVLCIIFFAASIVIQGQKKDNQQANQQYQSQLTWIDEQKNSLEANVAIKNFDKAKALLGELKQRLESFPRKSKDQQAKYAELQNQFTALSHKVNRLAVIADPTILVDLATIAPQAKGLGLKNFNQTLYLFDQQSEVYRLDKDGKITLIDKGLADQPKFQLATKVENNWVLYQDKKLYEMNSKDEKFSLRNVTWPQTEMTITAMAGYQNKLYLVDQKNNQIYKHTRLSTGYTKGANWLLDPEVKMTDVTAMGIDGDVYLATAQGEIIKLLYGKREEFKVESFEPGLAGVTKIVTDSDMANLYLLQPAQKRLIVIDKKEGKLINQYQSDRFDALTDLVVLEKEKIAYLLNGAKIYKISL